MSDYIIEKLATACRERDEYKEELTRLREENERLKGFSRLASVADERDALKAENTNLAKRQELLMERGLAIQKERDSLRTKLAQAEKALETIADDSWYNNGFVVCDDEQSRRHIVFNKVNHSTQIARTTLKQIRGEG